MLIPQIAPRALSQTTKTQEIASQIGKIIPDKLSRTFEMNQVGTIERIPLVLLSFVFVLGARFVKSRDAHEKREVLTRDGITIGAAMLGVPVVKNWLQRGLDKISKIPTATEKTKLFSLSDFGFDNIKNWYSKANMLPEQVLTLAKSIKERGGDIAVAFSKLGKPSQQNLKIILDGAEATSENILTALETAFKAEKGSKANIAFNRLTRVLSNSDNGLVRAAQRLKAIPNLASIIIVTALLGWGIPAFNIHFTRNKLKHGQNEKNLEPQLSNTQKQIIDNFLAKI